MAHSLDPLQQWKVEVGDSPALTLPCSIKRIISPRTPPPGSPPRPASGAGRDRYAPCPGGVTPLPLSKRSSHAAPLTGLPSRASRFLAACPGSPGPTGGPTRPASWGPLTAARMPSVRAPFGDLGPPGLLPPDPRPWGPFPGAGGGGRATTTRPTGLPVGVEIGPEPPCRPTGDGWPAAARARRRHAVTEGAPCRRAHRLELARASWQMPRRATSPASARAIDPPPPGSPQARSCRLCWSRLEGLAEDRWWPPMPWA